MSHPPLHHHDAHGGHSHAHGVTNKKRLAWAFAIITAFMVLEVAGGLLSGSLALLADAGHMASDAAALAFSWFAIHIGQRAATHKHSYGFRRLEVLAAFVNGLALFFIAGWIVIEAGHRLLSPAPVLGGPMLLVAIAGLLANIAAFAILVKGSPENLNLRSALLHVLGDLLGSVAAIAAAVVILWTGWTPIDPILSVVVALIILRSAWQVVRDAAHILLEAAPPGVDIAAIRDDLRQNVAPLADAHHIHVWSVTAESHLVTLHAVPASGATPAELIIAIQARLAERFGITHVTVQVEENHCHDGPPAGTGNTSAAQLQSCMEPAMGPCAADKHC